MFGSGIGALNVYLKTSDGSNGLRKIWSLTGDSGNNWYMGQAPIASPLPYKIVFEGVVGKNRLGNIALDDVSLSPGACPTSPQVATSNGVDCAFEDDLCGWKNPERRDNVDEINWERVEARSAGSVASGDLSGRSPTTDHTTGTRNGFYTALSRESVQKAGDRGLMVSKEMEGSTRDFCLSFWYYMFEPIIDNTGPNLGKLAVMTRSVDGDGNVVLNQVWRMHNGQGPSWKHAQAKLYSESNYQVS